MSEYKIWVEDVDRSTEYEVAIARTNRLEPSEHMHEIARTLRLAADEFDRQGFLSALESESP